MLKLSAKRVAIGALWIITMVAAMGTGAYGYKYRAQIRALLRSVNNDPAIMTNLYSLKVQKITIPAEGRDGGIAPLGDGILFINRMGQTWYVGADKKVGSLNFTVPVNITDFMSDPYNADVLYADLFGVKDVAVQRLDGRVRVLASHNHWNRAERCNTLRVSAMEVTERALLAGDTAGVPWRTVFESSPCRPLEPAGDGRNRVGLAAGGRLAPLQDGRILLSVGGFDPENELVFNAPQKSDNSYGKTIWLDPAAGTSGIYTIGHRNPQGLATTSTGEVWLTEHGPRGGDELNRIRDGGNYGYPHVVYGTQYDQMAWPLSQLQGRHEGFEKPTFAWTPSIGISQVVVPESSLFPHWRGDILVSSLNAQSLFRVRLEGDRVVLVEPIPIGHRIRDVIETRDGAIVMKTDDSFLIFLTPLNAATATTPVERGSLVAAQCQACHSLAADGGIAIGPPLWNVIGREVASINGFTYSSSLENVGGRWTPARVREFLANPASFAPGTTMTLASHLDDEQLDDLLAYLQTLK